MNKKIMIVDDEPKLCQMIQTYLEKEGYATVTAGNGSEALGLLRQSKPDLLLLDWMLPDKSGLDVLREIRTTSRLPVIMLTAKAEEVDKLLGLEIGADDYITKPFSLRELTARVKALLRRSGFEEVKQSLDIGVMRINLEEHSVFIDGSAVELTPTEFSLLAFLAQNSGRVYTRLQLLEYALQDGYEGYERSLDTHISNLRKKIQMDRSDVPQIKTVHGVGYKLEAGKSL